MKAHGLSYAEIGERNGWSYTKVNRAVTEGRRRFISTLRGDRVRRGVRALRADRPGAERGLGDDGPGASDPAAPAPLQRLPSHGPRAARLQAAPRVPVLADLRPHQPQARDRRAVPPSPGVRPRHRHRARQRGRRRPGRDRRRRARAVPRRRDGRDRLRRHGHVPDLGGDEPARVHAKHDRRPARSAPAKRRPPQREPPVVTKAALSSAAETTPAPKPKASRRATQVDRQAKKEAAPREFGFENQAPAASTAEPSATTASSTPTDADQDARPRRSAPPSRSSCRDVPPQSRPDRPLLLRRRLDGAARPAPPSRAVRPVRRPVDDAGARASGRYLRRRELLVRLKRPQRQRVHPSATTRA